MEYTLEDYGRALTMQKITPGNTQTAIADDILTYTERIFSYTSGGTTEIKAGDWIVGATSAKMARVVSVTLSTGTWAGGNAAGTMIVNSMSGAFTAGEKIKVGAGTDDATMTASPVKVAYDYENKEAKARAVFIQCMTGDALVCFDGSLPDQTLLSGITIGNYGTLSLSNYQNAKNFYCIDRVASTTSILVVVGYF